MQACRVCQGIFSDFSGFIRVPQGDEGIEAHLPKSSREPMDQHC